MREWLKYCDATVPVPVPVPVPYTILEFEFYIRDRADIAQEYTQKQNAKGLGFRTFDSISILCANFCTRKKNQTESQKADARAQDAIHTICMHAHMCVRRPVYNP